MDDLYVVGVAMTRFGPHPDDSLDDMVGAVLQGVTADARASVADVESAYYGSLTQSMLIGQGSIGAQVALRPHGVESIPVVNVENAFRNCASGLWTECPWFLDETAARWRGVVPKSRMCARAHEA